MRVLLPLLLSAAAALSTAPSVLAHDFVITVEGQVFFSQPSVPGPPFTGVVVGDPFLMTFSILDQPVSAGPGTLIYPIRGHSSRFDVGGLSFGLRQDFGTVQVTNDSIFGDVLILAAQIETSVGRRGLSAQMADPAGTQLVSADLNELLGTVLDGALPSSLLGSAGFQQTPPVLGLDVTNIRIGPAGDSPIGTPYCTALVNSTMWPALMRADGSTAVVDNDVMLIARRMPENSFGFFLTSRMQGFVQTPGGSQGNLCLSGPIGRYVGPGQVLNSGPQGRFELGLDLTRMPTPTGLVAAQAGETWHFTAWYRDAITGVTTSNFTDGLSVAFQ